MIAVGVDLVEVASVEASLATHAERYLERVYTDRELCESRSPDGTPDARKLAARFAAKEAALKAMNVGDEPIPWRSIGVRSESCGAPTIELRGAAAALARTRGIERLALSLTHEGPFAAAVVVAEADR